MQLYSSPTLTHLVRPRHARVGHLGSRRRAVSRRTKARFLGGPSGTCRNQGQATERLNRGTLGGGGRGTTPMEGRREECGMRKT